MKPVESELYVVRAWLLGLDRSLRGLEVGAHYKIDSFGRNIASFGGGEPSVKLAGVILWSLQPAKIGVGSNSDNDASIV
jgi:hypothetical protein